MKRKTGFTIIELLIVLAIMGLLTTIMIPSYFQHRSDARKNKCLDNMTILMQAVQQYAIDYKAAAGGIPAESIIWGESNSYITSRLYCPEGTSRNATYDIPAVGAIPVCKLARRYPGHKVNSD